VSLDLPRVKRHQAIWLALPIVFSFYKYLLLVYG
jgi:hypothetical protein